MRFFLEMFPESQRLTFQTFFWNPDFWLTLSSRKRNLFQIFNPEGQNFFKPEGQPWDEVLIMYSRSLNQSDLENTDF